jgi:hypothetical protein
MYYAENEDAPEIMAGALAEFEDLLDKLEADQLPRQKNRRFSSGSELIQLCGSRMSKLANRQITPSRLESTYFPFEGGVNMVDPSLS